jgi:hypothetical protein
MTVEVAVMNQQAVALAADSAVTVTGEHGTKIYTSANKIFALSKYSPLGVMVYGSATISGLPWETVIKVYRTELSQQTFAHLPEHADHFVRWLASTPMLSGDVESHFVQLTAISFLGAIRSFIVEGARETIASKPDGEELTLREVRKIVRDVVANAEKFVESRPERSLPKGFTAKIVEAHEVPIDKAIESVLENLPLSAAVRGKLRRLAVAPLVRQIAPEDSGIVIAGFGESDYVPRLRSYRIDGVVLGQAIYSDHTTADLSHRRDDSAYIAAFAQPDFTVMFMEGVHPRYQEFIEAYLERAVDRLCELLKARTSDTDLTDAIDVLRNELLGQYAEELERQRFASYIEPVLDAVGSLPKDELGALAESLVNLTVLKKRVSHEPETVGGPVDVAVISKGDGLVWIQRKHYFDPSLNHHFFANYYRGVSDAD